MPCSDGRDNRYYDTEYRNEKNNNLRLQSEINYLSACLCALLTELEAKGIFNDVVNCAQKNGKIDIKRFWKEHSIKDKERRIKKFNELSEHEKELYKQLLKNGEI